MVRDRLLESMSTSKTPSYLQGSDKARLRRLFCRHDNLDQLIDLIRIYVRDYVFPTCPSPDPDDLKIDLITDIGQELRKAILDKLKRCFPKDAHREDTLLLKYYPDKGAALLQQALGYLVDIWVQDSKLHLGSADDTLVKKCQRLLPSMSSLPVIRGKSAHGMTFKLCGLVVFDDVRVLLRGLPRTKRQDNLSTDEIARRKRFFSKVLFALENNTTHISPPPPTIIKDLFSVASANGYEDWLRLSRTEIALDLAGQATGQTSDYFLHSISRLRIQARGLAVTPLKSTH